MRTGQEAFAAHLAESDPVLVANGPEDPRWRAAPVAACVDVWAPGVLRGYPLLRERGARLAAEGHPFVDATRVFADVEETLYYDSCHFVAAGHELLAEALAPHVIDALATAR